MFTNRMSTTTTPTPDPNLLTLWNPAFKGMWVFTRSGPSGDQDWTQQANRGDVTWNTPVQIRTIYLGHGDCAECKDEQGRPVSYNESELDLSLAATTPEILRSVRQKDREEAEREKARKLVAHILWEPSAERPKILGKCYLYGVIGQTGTGGLDLIAAQTFSSSSPTFFNVDPTGLVVLLHETTGDDYSEARKTMLANIETGGMFPDPWQSKVCWLMRRELASGKGYEAWQDLYDREHFEGKYKISREAPATTAHVFKCGDVVHHVDNSNEQGEIILLAPRESGASVDCAEVQWFRGWPRISFHPLTSLVFESDGLVVR